MDAKQILSSYPIEQVIGRYLDVRKKGSQYQSICPFHSDTKPSLKINSTKHIAKCFACGWGGDTIKFVMDYTNSSFVDACREITGNNISGPKFEKKVIEKKTPDWIQCVPPSPVKSINHYMYGKPSKVWVYKTKEGKSYGYICRFDTPEGKEIMPYVYATNGNKQEWRFMGFSLPRPLYNLDLIEKYKEAKIIIVEGEKCADHLQKIIGSEKLVVTTWIGGTNAVHNTDWSPIKDRSILQWPDNDVQGLNAMLHIQHIIERKIMIIPITKSLPKGWDCADKEWTKDEVYTFIKKCQLPPKPNFGPMWRLMQIQSTIVYEFGPTKSGWRFAKIEPVIKKKAAVKPPFRHYPPV
jgi:hypothetical protein